MKYLVSTMLALVLFTSTVEARGPLRRLFRRAFHINSCESQQSQQTVYSFRLMGRQEVPHVHTLAYGTAHMVLNKDEDKLTVFLRLRRLDLDGRQTIRVRDNVVGIHIHNAERGANGPVVFGMMNPGSAELRPRFGTVSAEWTEGLAQHLEELKNGELYVNVHTRANPLGEIRGQIE